LVAETELLRQAGATLCMLQNQSQDAESSTFVKHALLWAQQLPGGS
jgi:hypothetical protein